MVEVDQQQWTIGESLCSALQLTVVSTSCYPLLQLQSGLFQCTGQLIPVILLAWVEFLSPPPITALPSEAEQLVGGGSTTMITTNKSEEVVDDD